MAQACEREAVVLTGFGPFQNHKTNDSWAAVCQIAEGDRGKTLEEDLKVRFILQQMPVCYEFADKTVPQLWEKHNPLFVLHVGINHDDVFRIETRSRKTNYHGVDINGRTPEMLTCPVGTEEVLKCRLDTDKLLEDVKSTLTERKTSVDIVLSDDPGNYLCGYTYYTSLCANAGRTLFLHIPPPHSPVPISSKVDVVEAVVVNSLQQIRQQCS